MDPKDQVISQLRAQIYQMKQAQAAHRALDQRISHLQTQYALAFDQKQRFDKQQKHQLNQDSSVILQIKRQIDILKNDIQRVNLQNQEKANEIVKLKKMADARAQDIQLNKKDCINLQNKNRTLFQGNKQIVLTIRNVKQQRLAIQADLQALQQAVASKCQLFRAKQKQIRDKEVELARMQKHLDALHSDLAKLQSQICQNQQLRNLKLQQIQKKSKQKDQFIKTLQALQGELQHWTKENYKNQKAYQQQLSAIKHLSKQKALLQAQMRQKQIAIDDLKSQKAKQTEIKNCLIEDNITLTNETDKNFKLVKQLTAINQQLQREIANYSQQDEAARKILDRKAKLKQALKINSAQLHRTASSIDHIFQQII